MKIDHYEVTAINNHVYRISENPAISIFLVEGNNEGLLIDTGAASGNLKAVVEELLKGKKYQVVHTHGHYDHVLADYQFNEVAIHPADIDVMKNVYANREQYIPLMKAWNVSEINIEQYLKGNWPQIKELQDGQIFDLGDVVVETISTPGHTYGCCCFLDKTDRILFTGDNVLRHSSLTKGNGTSIQEYLAGLNKIIAREKEIDLTMGCHGHKQPSFRPLDMSYVKKLVRCGVNIVLEKAVYNPKEDTYQYYVDGKGYNDYEDMCIEFTLAQYQDYISNKQH